VGRTPLWTAFKRAEVDLYRALFPTMMAAVAQAQQETIKISDGPKWQEFTGEEIDDMFSYGDVPENQDIDVETGEYVEVDADAYQPDYDDFEPHVPDGGIEDEEPEETAVHHDPEFWQESALNAKGIDGLSQAIYKLHEASGVFNDAAATKKAIIHICGKGGENANVMAAIAKYVNAVADGTEKKTAVVMAKEHYLKLAE
jgi:hypothetical protein